MKKTFTRNLLIVGYFLLIGTISIVASVPGNIEKVAKENVRREIIRNINCPNFVTENSETNDVKALVSVGEDGTITVHEINSGNQQLKNYVAGTLKEMKIKNTEPVEKFVLVVKFRVA